MENENAIATTEPKELTEQKKEKWTPAQIESIKKLIAPNAKPEDLTAYLSMAAKYDLDPFAREIWLINMRGRNTIMTSRDGYLTIANRNPHYKGMQSDVVYTGDKFFKDEQGVHHAYNVGNRGNIIGAYAEVYRDDRNVPAYFFAPMRDYNKNNDVWRQYPQAMIQKVAEAAALKRAFSISGLVTEDEVSYQTIEAEYKELPQPQQKKPLSPSNAVWLRYYRECNKNKDEAVKLIKSLIGDKPSSEWTDDDIAELNNYLDTFDTSQLHKDYQPEEIIDVQQQEDDNGNENSSQAL